MIKLFRQFRRRLIEQDNMGKYFKYAIGEILLVVIGILIALQINNWNEQQKKDHLKEEYKNALINDCVKDTVQLGSRMRQNERALASIDSLLSIVNIESRNEKNTIEIIKQIGFNSYSRISNAYNTNSFNLLISSGGIDLFEENIRQEIMELNRLQIYEQTVSKSNKEVYFNTLQTIYSRYPNANFGGFSEQFLQTAWDSVDTNSILVDFFNFYTFRRYVSFRYLQLTEAILEQTKKVIDLLKEKD